MDGMTEGLKQYSPKTQFFFLFFFFVFFLGGGGRGIKHKRSEYQFADETAVIHRQICAFLFSYMHKAGFLMT